MIAGRGVAARQPSINGGSATWAAAIDGMQRQATIASVHRAQLKRTARRAHERRSTQIRDNEAFGMACQAN